MQVVFVELHCTSLQFLDPAVEAISCMVGPWKWLNRQRAVSSQYLESMRDDRYRR